LFFSKKSIIFVLVQIFSRFLYYGGEKIQAESPVVCDFLYKKICANYLRLTFHFSLASVMVFQWQYKGTEFFLEVLIIYKKNPNFSNLQVLWLSSLIRVRNRLGSLSYQQIQIVNLGETNSHHDTFMVITPFLIILAYYPLIRWNA